MPKPSRQSKQHVPVAATATEASPIVLELLSDEEKKAKTEAVAAEIKESLERHGCVLSVSRWIDDDGRIQAGMTIMVKTK